MSFVNVTKDDFEYLLSTHTDGKWMLPKNGMEYVILIPIPKTKFEIHVYTSVDSRSDDARKSGSDAIRCVLYDAAAAKIIGTTKRVNRTESSHTSLFDRVNDRVSELKASASAQETCSKCGAHTVERTNRKTGETFRGCGAFPNCNNITHLRNKYPLIEVNDQLVASLSTSYSDEISKETRKPVVAPKISGQTELVKETDLVPTVSYPHRKFPFDYFNRVQSTIMKEGYWNADVNLVLGTSTSSGKTVSAELFLGHTLYAEKKVTLYSAPLKALSSEKYSEWTERYDDKSVVIMTGDYVLTDQRAEELRQADIICMTSEMVDSRTRNHQSEKSDWIQNVGLVIIDESHIIATNRGHAVEVGLMRFAKLNPSARILLLSATMPNVYDFEQWLTTINNKPTKVINNTWRPTKLHWTYTPHMISGRYQEIEANKRQLALDAVQEKPNEKFLIFVHAKNTGHQLVAMLKHHEIEAQFHNADLELKDRLEIEKSFENRTDGLRVLVSTSTLAWGRNLPARNVVVVGTTRGLDEVDDLDIIQMSGRAGRVGYDNEGFCNLICDNPTMWEYRTTNPKKVLSQLLDPEILAFHILAEINNREIWNKETIHEWYKATLAYIQTPLTEEIVDVTISNLINWGMIRVDDSNGVITITNIGKISATLYYLPTDVNHWRITFDRLAQNDVWESDAALCYALGAAPSVDLGYVPRTDTTEVEEYMRVVRNRLKNHYLPASFTAYKLHEWLTQQESSPITRNVKNDIDRVTSALVWMSGIKRWTPPAGYWKALPLRIKYGVNKELIPLCQLPGIGAVRAKKLYAEGVKSLTDVVNNQVIISKIMKNQAPKVIKAARALIRQEQSETA